MITLTETTHLYWILALSLFLLAILLALEVIQRNERLHYRIIALVSCLLSILAILLKPAWIEKSEDKTLILLSDDYDPAKLDSLTKKVKGQVIGLDSLHSDYSKYDRIFLLGAGVPVYDLWRLKGRDVTFIPGDYPEGITRVRYPAHVTAGESIRVQGEYHHTGANDIELRLSGPGGVADSITIKASGTTSFSLKARTVSEGNLLYTLEVLDSAATLGHELVPVTVEAPVVMNVLILNAYPTFETRSLKQLLVSEGHKVVVRNKITRGRYSYEYYRTNTRPIRQLTRMALQPFDLLIIDHRSFKELAKREITALKRQVDEEGLALFIQPDENMFGRRSKWPGFSFVATGSEELELIVDDKVLRVPSYPYRPVARLGMEKIKENTLNSAFFLYHSGRGKIGSTLLTRTYPLRLQGDSVYYNHLWNDIFEKLLSGKRDRPLSKDQFIYENEPAMVYWPGETTRPVSVHYENEPIPPAEETLIPGRWSYPFWPNTPGWNTLITHQDTVQQYFFYTHGMMDWYTVRRYEQIRANLRAFSSTHRSKKINDGEARVYEKMVNPLWFYLIFLASAGYLWIEPKL